MTSTAFITGAGPPFCLLLRIVGLCVWGLFANSSSFFNWNLFSLDITCDVRMWFTSCMIVLHVGLDRFFEYLKGKTTAPRTAYN